MTGRAYHGWYVAPVKDRQYKGVTYHSRLEANRARELDLLFSTITGFWRRQVPIPLGEDYTTKMDVVCLEVFEAPGQQPEYYEWCEEVEGRKTAKHRRVRALWNQYQSGSRPAIRSRRSPPAARPGSAGSTGSDMILA